MGFSGVNNFPTHTIVDGHFRQVLEETGIDAALHRLVDWQLTNEYEIYPQWRHRYAPCVR